MLCWLERNSVRRDQRDGYLAVRKKERSDSVMILMFIKSSWREREDYRSVVMVLFKDTNRRILFIQ